MKPEQYLMVLVGLLNRLAMSDAEKLGANACVETLKKSLDELEAFKAKAAAEALEKNTHKNGSD